MTFFNLVECAGLILCDFSHVSLAHPMDRLYVATKAKCRHLKNGHVKGVCGQVFIRVYRLEIDTVSHVGNNAPD
jgi:hypothetical protein